MKIFTRTIGFDEKELEKEMGRIDDLIYELREALLEALEWIERPVEDQDDAAQFLAFEQRAKALARGRNVTT